jgi:hypothetical protein
VACDECLPLVDRLMDLEQLYIRLDTHLRDLRRRLAQCEDAADQARIMVEDHETQLDVHHQALVAVQQEQSLLTQQAHGVLMRGQHETLRALHRTYGVVHLQTPIHEEEG